MIFYTKFSFGNLVKLIIVSLKKITNKKRCAFPTLPFV